MTGPMTQDFASRRPASRGRFLVAIGIAAVWFALLTTLAVTTANPPTLNREQLLRSDFVVTATLSDSSAHRIRVEREWKRGAEFGSLQVENLDNVPRWPSSPLIVPLSSLGEGRFWVTPTPLPGGTPLVYPLTDRTLDQLRSILDERPASNGHRRASSFH